MTNRVEKFTRAALAATAITAQLAVASLPVAQAQTQTGTRKSAFEEGTVIPAKLNETLTSNDSRPGDAFTATIVTDKGDYYDRLPRGTRIEGVVRVAKAKKDKDPGVLELSFQRLRYPNGRSQAIEGSLVGLDNKSVTKTSDGRLVAKSKSKNDRLTYVGIGAGAGLIVSLFTKRTFQDTLIGAGLGYLFGSLQKSDSQPRDVVLKPGTEFGIRIDRRLSYTVNNNWKESDGTDRREINRDINTDRDSSSNVDANRDSRQEEDRAAAKGIRETGEDIGVLFGDKSIRFESNARPVVSDGTVLVPFRPVLQEARIKFNYDEGKQTLTANGKKGDVRIVAGSRVALVDNERRVRLQTSARKLNGTLYVPMRFLAIALGQDVTWDEGSRTVIIGAPENDVQE